MALSRHPKKPGLRVQTSTGMPTRKHYGRATSYSALEGDRKLAGSQVQFGKVYGTVLEYVPSLRVGYRPQRRIRLEKDTLSH